jgi:hypothetical protein
VRRLAAILLVAWAAVARADGGIPQTLQIHVAADRPDSLYVVSNYGLLVSHDRGCTFEWVCEQNVGYGGAYIPQFAVTRDGTILATSFAGLRVSRDGGCNFETPTAEVFVASVDIAPTGAIWVTTAEAGITNDVLVSTDGAQTFEPAGLASSSIRWESVRVAPSDPDRVYVLGVDADGVAQLRRRDGAAWTVLPVTDLGEGTLRIAAVDPTNGDVVYVAAEGGRFPQFGDRLYRSTDGGATFAPVFEIEGFLRDVRALDAQETIVTTMVYSGPILVGGTPMRSTDGGASFAPFEGAPTLACIAVAPDGDLLGCGANWEPDFMAVARREGDTWTKVFRFTELLGPLACPVGSGGERTCTPGWRYLDDILKTKGPTCGPHARDGAPPEIPPPPSPPPESCCGVAARPSSLAWVLVLAWMLVRPRRASGAR